MEICPKLTPTQTCNRRFTTKGRDGAAPTAIRAEVVAGRRHQRASHAVGRLAAEPLEELGAGADPRRPARHRSGFRCVGRGAGAGAALTEPEVVLPMLHNFAGVWRALYPAEQLRSPGS